MHHVVEGPCRWPDRLIGDEEPLPAGEDVFWFTQYRELSLADGQVFWFDHAFTATDGRCFLEGMACSTLADCNAFLADARNRPHVLVVSPHYLASQLVLSGYPVPLRLAGAAWVRIDDPACPVKITDPHRRIASIRVGEEWKPQPPISDGALRVANALIAAYPKPLGKRELAEASGLTAPWKILKALCETRGTGWAGVIVRPGRNARGGYVLTDGHNRPQDGH